MFACVNVSVVTSAQTKRNMIITNKSEAKSERGVIERKTP